MLIVKVISVEQIAAQANGFENFANGRKTLFRTTCCIDCCNLLPRKTIPVPVPDTQGRVAGGFINRLGSEHANPGCDSVEGPHASGSELLLLNKPAAV
jgi:hypothetical protein